MFPDYSVFQCVNETYSDFTTKLMGVIDNIAPIKEIRVKGNSKPWFDGSISEAINLAILDRSGKREDSIEFISNIDCFRDDVIKPGFRVTPNSYFFDLCNVVNNTH